MSAIVPNSSSFPFNSTTNMLLFGLPLITTFTFIHMELLQSLYKNTTVRGWLSRACYYTARYVDPYNYGGIPTENVDPPQE